MARQDSSVRGTAAAEPGPLLHRLGGEEGVWRWVDRFYDRIAADPVLAPLFTRDLDESKRRQHAFFVEFFGGAARYSERFGRPFMRFRHRHVKIGPAERDAWMRLVMESLAEEVSDEDTRAETEARLAAMADRMMNHHPERRDAYFFN